MAVTMGSAAIATAGSPDDRGKGPGAARATGSAGDGDHGRKAEGAGDEGRGHGAEAGEHRGHDGHDGHEGDGGKGRGDDAHDEGRGRDDGGSDHGRSGERGDRGDRGDRGAEAARAALHAKVVAALKGHAMSDAMKQELRRHATNQARLERVIELAEQAKDGATVDKARKVLEQETARHEHWMGGFDAETGRSK